jgi:DNA-directed RNA polymerase specialized sigma24 family protein
MTPGCVTDPLQPLLNRLAAGDPSAVDRLIEHSVQRLHRLAHFMLQQYPVLINVYETGDVAQAAAVRLMRALREVAPATPRHFMNLAATQIRRELCDLARHEFGPEGPGGNEQTAPWEGGEGGREEPSPQHPAASGPGPSTQVRWRDLLS